MTPYLDVLIPSLHYYSLRINSGFDLDILRLFEKIIRLCGGSLSEGKNNNLDLILNVILKEFTKSLFKSKSLDILIILIQGSKRSHFYWWVERKSRLSII
jgi:hypothetical protein